MIKKIIQYFRIKKIKIRKMKIIKESKYKKMLYNYQKSV